MTFQSAPAGTSTWTDACTANDGALHLRLEHGRRGRRLPRCPRGGRRPGRLPAHRRCRPRLSTTRSPPPPSTIPASSPAPSRSPPPRPTPARASPTLAISYRPAGGSWTTLCTGSTTPRTCSLNTAPLADGSYELRATATDVAGNVARHRPHPHVDNTAPTAGVNATSPVRGTIDRRHDRGRRQRQRHQAGHRPLPRLRHHHLVDGLREHDRALRLHRPRHDADARRHLRGPALAEDNAGFTTTSATATLRVDNTAPATATLTNPGSPLSGTETLSGGATDAGSGIASWTVQYKLSSGSTLGRRVLGHGLAVRQLRWDTTDVADGLYDLRASPPTPRATADLRDGHQPPRRQHGPDGHAHRPGRDAERHRRLAHRDGDRRRLRHDARRVRAQRRRREHLGVDLHRHVRAVHLLVQHRRTRRRLLRPARSRD